MSKARTALGPSSAEQKRWQAKDDVRTLMRADEIKRDSGRMNRAKKAASQQAREAARVAGKIGKR